MSSDSPAVILYDASGVALAVSNGVAIPAGTQGLLTAGSDGTNARFLRVAADGTVRTDPTGTTIQPVRVTDGTNNQPPVPTTLVPATAIGGSAVGRRAGVNANTFVDVRQTTYTEQTTNAQRSLASTSANDTSAGTGARQVVISYLDQTCSGPGGGVPFFTETVTLNGLTPVNTVNTNICFIERIDVLSVGSSGANVGTINLYTTTAGGGTIFASIGTGALATGLGDNETLW